MNPSSESRFTLLLRRLATAHRDRADQLPGSHWRVRVMAAVHRSQAAGLRAPDVLSADRLVHMVWRAALAASLAAVIAAGYTLAQPEGVDLAAAMLFDDPVESLMAPLSDNL
jgi:hypothetical protein